MQLSSQLHNPIRFKRVLNKRNQSLSQSIKIPANNEANINEQTLKEVETFSFFLVLLI